MFFAVFFYLSYIFASEYTMNAIIKLTSIYVWLTDCKCRKKNKYNFSHYCKIHQKKLIPSEKKEEKRIDSLVTYMPVD